MPNPKSKIRNPKSPIENPPTVDRRPPGKARLLSDRVENRAGCR